MKLVVFIFTNRNISCSFSKKHEVGKLPVPPTWGLTSQAPVLQSSDSTQGSLRRPLVKPRDLCPLLTWSARTLTLRLAQNVGQSPGVCSWPAGSWGRQVGHSQVLSHQGTSKLENLLGACGNPLPSSPLPPGSPCRGICPRHNQPAMQILKVFW